MGFLAAVPWVATWKQESPSLIALLLQFKKNKARLLYDFPRWRLCLSLPSHFWTLKEAKFVLSLIKTPYALLDSEVADTTMAWRWMSGGAARAAFNCHTSTDYVLGRGWGECQQWQLGWELSAPGTGGLTPLGNTTGSGARLCSPNPTPNPPPTPPPPAGGRGALWLCRWGRTARPLRSRLMSTH